MEYYLNSIIYITVICINIYSIWKYSENDTIFFYFYINTMENKIKLNIYHIPNYIYSIILYCIFENLK